MNSFIYFRYAMVHNLDDALNIYGTPANVKAAEMDPMNINGTPANVKMDPMNIYGTPANVKMDPMNIYGTPANVKAAEMDPMVQNHDKVKDPEGYWSAVGAAL